MDFLMREELYVKVEGGLAFGTFIAFLHVGILLLSKMNGLAETLARLIALVGFTSIVGFLLLNRLGART